jgi:hypothetical protein
MYNSLYHLFSTNPELINNGVLLIDFNCNTTKPCSHKIQFIDANNNILVDSTENAFYISYGINILNVNFKYINKEPSNLDEHDIKMHFSYINLPNLPPSNCTIS